LSETQNLGPTWLKPVFHPAGTGWGRLRAWFYPAVYSEHLYSPDFKPLSFERLHACYSCVKRLSPMIKMATNRDFRVRIDVQHEIETYALHFLSRNLKVYASTLMLHEKYSMICTNKRNIWHHTILSWGQPSWKSDIIGPGYLFVNRSQFAAGWEFGRESSHIFWRTYRWKNRKSLELFISYCLFSRVKVTRFQITWNYLPWIYDKEQDKSSTHVEQRA